MTDIQPYQRPDLLDPATDSWVASVGDVVRLAEFICNTTFVPQGLRGSAPATAATILYGREIGIPPITALQTMHVVNGRVGMAAELLRARVYAAGHDLEILESTAAVCRIRGRRRGSETWTTVAWSKGDAQQAGLGGDAWKKYPRAMLQARASAELCRLVFPDVTHGMAALEELDGAATTAEPQTDSPPKLVGRQPRKQPPPREAPEPAPPGDAPSVEPVGVAPDLPQAGLSAPHAPAQPAVAPQQPLLPGEESGETDESPPQQRGPAPSAGVVLDESDPQTQAALTGDGPATQPQVRHIMVLLRRLNLGAQRDERLAIAEAIVQRRLESFSQLTVTDAGRLITTMLLAVESANPRDYMRWLVDEGQRLLAEREAADREAIAQADAEAAGGVGDE
jgi:hypothetical protein